MDDDRVMPQPCVLDPHHPGPGSGPSGAARRRDGL